MSTSWIPALTSVLRSFTSAITGRTFAQRIAIPAFTYTCIVKDVPYRVARANIVLPTQQVLTSYARPHTYTGYSLIVTFIRDGMRYNYSLWRGAGSSRLPATPYAGQRLPLAFAIEVWPDSGVGLCVNPATAYIALSTRDSVGSVLATGNFFLPKEIRSTPTTFPSQEYAI